MVAAGKSDKSRLNTVYHEDELERGWRLLRQHLALEVDIHRHALRGTATFSLRALNKNCFTIGVNLRRARVLSCCVDGIPAEHRLHGALDDRLLLEEVSGETPHRVESIMREATELRKDIGDGGELIIYVPQAITARVNDELFDAEREAVNTPELHELPRVPHAAVHKLPPLSVTVSYEVRDPSGGAFFYGSPHPEHLLTDPAYMLTESRYGQVRSWMPCLDSLRWCDRCFFDLDINVAADLAAISSGDLINMQLFENDRKLFIYRSTVPAHAHEIVVAVGPFLPYADPTLPKTVTHFCLPGHAHELVHTGPPLFAKALAFCRDYFGFDPPCTSFKQLFVGRLGEKSSINRCAGGGLAVLSGNLLHEERNIDAGFEAREAIMGTLVQSYIGCLLRPREADDAWLIAGLAAHVTNLGLRSVFGNNWYRFRIMDEMRALFKESPSESVLLSQVDRSVHVDLTAEKVRRRALVVVYIVEKRIGSDIMRRALRDSVAEGRTCIVALSEMLELCRKANTMSCGSIRDSMHSTVVKAFKSTPNSLDLMRTNEDGDDEDDEDLTQGASKRLASNSAQGGFDDSLLGISVGHFLKRLRAICGHDVRSLVRSWASSTGIPRIRFGYRYNVRRHVVEFVLVQDGIDGNLVKGKPGIPINGQVCVRVMEVEGATEHNVDVQEMMHTTELHLLSRRTKKGTNQSGKDEKNDTLRLSPICFVRIDPEQEWCMDYTIGQPDSALISMLQSDRDAIGQYRACRELARSDNPNAAKALAGILEDDQVYWRVHAEAANSLATCKGGLELLLAFCRSRYTNRGDDGRENVRRNDFSNYAKYFVKRAIVKAIVKSREFRIGAALKARILPEAIEFTIELLKGNDNAGNKFDDDYYVADLLRAAGSLAVESIDDQPMGKIKVGQLDKSFATRLIQQIERFVALDRLLPGKTGAVTCALLRTLSEFEVVRLAVMEKRGVGTPVQDIVRGLHKPNKLLSRLIEKHVRFEAPMNVRLEALRAFALVYGGTLSICDWLLARVDQYSNELQIIDAWSFPDKLPDDPLELETPAVRLAVMTALKDAVSTKLWGKFKPPLLTALRRNTSRARGICVRVRKLIVADVDDRVRKAAYEFATFVWGLGAPVCLMDRTQYQEACRMVELTPPAERGKHRPVVPPSRRAALGAPVWPKSKPKTSGKPAKAHKGKVVKPPKAVVPPQEPLIQPLKKASSGLPRPPPPNGGLKHTNSVAALKVLPPKPSPYRKPIGKISIPMAKPLNSAKALNLPKPLSSMKTLSSPKSPPGSTSRSKSQTTSKHVSNLKTDGLSFSPDELDGEDMEFMRKVWDEERRLEEGRDDEEKRRRGATSEIRPVDYDEMRPLNDDPEPIHSRGSESHEHRDVVITGSDETRKEKKKKKKKKRKREDGDDRADGDREARREKRKKKKKHKHKNREDYDMNVNVDGPPLNGSVEGAAAPS